MCIASQHDADLVNALSEDTSIVGLLHFTGWIVNSIKRLKKHNQQRGCKYQRRMKRRIAKPEKVLMDALNRHEIWFKHQPMYFDEAHLFLPDFLIIVRGRRVIIEVDGPEHAAKRASGYEHRRWFWMRRNRHIEKIVRFTNERVMSDVEGVVAEILRMNPKKAVEPAWMTTEPEEYEMPVVM